MNRFFDRYKEVIIWIMVIGFFLGGVGLVAFRYLTPSSGSSGGSEPTKSVALVVNGEEVYEETFQSMYDNIIAQQESLYSQYGQDFNQLLEGTSGKYYELRLKSRAMDTLVRQTIIAQEANNRGIKPNQEEVNSRYDKELNSLLDQQNWNLDQLKSALSSQGRTYDEFQETVKTNIEQQVKQEQLQSEVTGEIDPTDEELQAYYSDNIDNYVQSPSRVRASHIVFETQTRATTVLEEIQTGSKGFDDYAEGQEEVDLGWFQRGEESPSVEELAFSLEKGEVGGPVETTDGWEILRVDDKEERVVPPLEEIKDQVRSDYVGQTQEEKYEQWYDEVEEGSDIQIKLPLVEAYRSQEQGFEQGIEAYQELKETDPGEYPYLPYYIGRLYQSRASELESQLSETSDEEKKKELENDVSEYNDRAVENYMEVVRTTGSSDAELLNRVLDIAPDDPEANYYLGEANLQQKKYKQARENFKNAVEAKDDYVAAYIKYGDVLVQLRNYEKAIEQYEKVLEMESDNVSVINKLALTYKKQDNYDKAEETYEKALEVDPGNFEAKKGLGDLYREEDNYEEAIQYYNDALAIRSDGETGVSLGRTYLSNGELEEAQKEFDNVLSTDPYNAEAYLGLGDVYMEKNMKEMALEEYQDGLARTQDSSLVIDLAKKIVELQPGDVETRFTLAEAYRDEHVYDSAIDQYDKILDATDGAAEKRDAYRGLGDTYVKKTEYDEAEKYYGLGVEISETDVQKLAFYEGLLDADEEENGSDNLTETGKEALLKIAEININQGNGSGGEEKLNRLKELDSDYKRDRVETLLEEIGGASSED
ncbi:MAG: tetratricopeptide repeat protein [Candidatus Bipolaricaulota bacterium]